MNQFDLNLQNLINDIPLIVGDIALTVGLDGKALIQQRVQEKGLDSNGNSTGSYSDPYAKRRANKGRQTKYVDLTDTGEMWRSTGFKEKRQDSRETVITIAGRDQFTQDKINWNSEKKFEVLKLSKEEEQIVSDNFDVLMTNTIIEYLERGIK